jgi:hypothetical protein
LLTSYNQSLQEVGNSYDNKKRPITKNK